MNSTGQHICRECGVICADESGRWVHPEPWRTVRSRRICDQPHPLREATPQEAKRGGIQLIRRDRWMKEEQLKQLVVAEKSRVEVAIVGYYQLHPSAHEHPRGWGYLASDGHYGFGATTTRRRFDGPGELAAEARALFWALRKLVPAYRVSLVTDYPEIADLVNAWRAGDVTAVPPGYDRSDRPSGREAKLMYVAPRVHQYADLVTVRVVEDYAGTALGRGADELSLIGWQWAAGETSKVEAQERALATASRLLDVKPVLVARIDKSHDGNEAAVSEESPEEQGLPPASESDHNMLNDSSPPRRKHLLNGRRVRISDLIDADLLKPGDELFFQQRIGEDPHQAVVTERGRLRLPDGREFTTPSRAGATVAKRRAVAGWSAWQVGRTGPTLHRLRLKLLQDVANEVSTDQETPQEEAEAVRRRFATLEAARAEAESGNPRSIAVREFIGLWGLEDRDRMTTAQIEADLANHGLATSPDFRAVSLDRSVRIVTPSEHEENETAMGGFGGIVTTSTDDVNEESVDIGLTLDNLFPHKMSLVSVSPSATFEEAITAMQINDYSQVAVLANSHTLHGSVSWESIAAARHRDPQASFSDAIDRRARDRVFDYDTRLLDVLGTLQQHGFIFVRDDQRKISGIVTAADVVRKYDETATPFFLIGEIDQELRQLIVNTFDEETVRQACIAARLTFRSLDTMSIGQYQAVLDNATCWEQLGWPLDRRVFIARLDELRKVRNNVMHFNPDPVRPSEVAKLRTFLSLIRRYSGR
ncbi:CBS domain-containing protein [Micromonospora purpureochromogenes]|uniref:restriction system modified-DNA reader domain-containing protein n=1 Tax=Micromonospora purpureochromogenes TaxID=47872 RepID=UPI0033C443CC